MNTFIKITLLVLLVWPKVFFGQTYFNMLYPPEPGTWGSGTHSIVVTNSTYVMNRWAINNSDGMPWVRFSVIKLEGDSILLKDTIHIPNIWTALAGLEQSENQTFTDVINYKNYTQSLDQYGIIKYGSNGHLIFNNTNNNLYPYIYIKQIIITQNNSSISTGDLDEIGNSWKDQKILLLKNDSLGNEIWKKTYSVGSYAEKGESVALCTDGGFIIGGAELIINGPDRFYSPIVIKTDSNGNVEWEKKYGSTQYSNWPAYGITQTQDGGYAFCGGIGIHDSDNVDEQLPWVVKLDSLGNILWADTNSGDNLTSLHVTTYFKDIIEMTDGSIVVCGQQLVWYDNKPAPDKYRWRGVIKKLSASGTPIWARYYSHPEIVDVSGTVHFLYDIDPTPDGGFVAAGWAAFTADNVQSTWVIKVDSFGCLVQGCEVNSVPKIQEPIAELNVYPNPTNGLLHIDITPSAFENLRPLPNQQNFNFELYDIMGKQVLVKTLHPFENTIDVSHLDNGIYTYKMGSIWGQIIKQ